MNPALAMRRKRRLPGREGHYSDPLHPEWLDRRVPNRFWEDRRNRLRYLRWLGRRLGFRTPDDWRRLILEDFERHRGSGAAIQYDYLPLHAVRELYPHRTWHEWEFSKVPAGFWQKRANRRRYMDWLGRKLKLRFPDDWLRVQLSDFQEHGGTGLANLHSLTQLIREHSPAAWRRRFGRLDENTVVAWAREHRQRTGRWPGAATGSVDGQDRSWHSIDLALRRGRHGLPGGDSLARLLQRRVGKTYLLGRPPLTIGQILAWADAHYARTGMWPKVRGGPVIDAPGETWFNIDCALAKGDRGLPGGTTMARLLQQHRGVKRHLRRPELDIETVLNWARAFRRRTGAWPTSMSGPVVGGAGVSWLVIHQSFKSGRRGLPALGGLRQAIALQA